MLLVSAEQSAWIESFISTTVDCLPESQLVKGPEKTEKLSESESRGLLLAGDDTTSTFSPGLEGTSTSGRSTVGVVGVEQAGVIDVLDDVILTLPVELTLLRVSELVLALRFLARFLLRRWAKGALFTAES